MRIVEYRPDTAIDPYRALRALGISSAVFAALVSLLMVANYLSLKRTDPIHSPALLALIEQLKTNPQDQALREEIRELDHLARKAVFGSHHFSQVGKYLLLFSAATAVVSFKSLERYKRRLPYPDPQSPKEDLAANARWARKAVTTAGLVLAGFALMLALPWNSPLDDPEAIAGPDAPAPSPAATLPATVSPAAAAPASPPAAAFPSRDDLLKNWPSFRGAAGGVAQSSELPVAWDGVSGEGIAWKVELPRGGFSSPVLWGGRIFLTGANQEAREVYCFSQQDGSLLWRHEIVNIPGAPATLPKVTEDTGLAAPTVATDGTRVFAIFATGEIVALDFNGRRVWVRALGVPENPFGHASSLVVFEDLVIVQMDHSKAGAIYALETETGDTRWKVDRDFGCSWASPALVENGGRIELITAASPPVIAFDPRTGEQLWRVDCLARGDVATVPVSNGEYVFVSGDNATLAAIHMKTRSVEWETSDLLPSVSTPAVAGEWLVYGLPDGGIACREARSGKEIWHHDTDHGFYASPIVAGDRVYLFDREGTTHIITAGEKFNAVGSPALGETVVATPAVSGNSLFIRGTKHLYRIGM